MPLPTARTDLSTTAASNSPAGSEAISGSNGPDDYLRTLSVFIRQNYDDIQTLDAALSGTNTGDVTIAAGRDYITISGQQLTLGAVDLTTDVTGSLPVANGGTGAATAADARTNLGVDAAGTDNSTNVTIAAGLDYVTIAGQQLTLNAVDLAADVTGALPVGSISGLGTNVATWLATPSSSNFAAAVTGETGTAGGVVFSDSPTFTGTVVLPSTTTIGSLTNAETAINKAAVKTYTAVAVDTGCQAGNAYLVTANSKTMTLPSTPSNGDWVAIANANGVTGTIVGRNSQNIMGVAEDMTCDLTNFAIILQYYSTGSDWRIVA